MLDVITSLFKKDAVKQSEPVDGEFYIRTGSCHGCGACCQNIYLVHNGEAIASHETFEALKPNNPEYAYFVPTEQTESGLQFRCTHLQPDNRCGIYENRPGFCRRYPMEQVLRMGGALAEECGYHFTLKRNFQSVLSEALLKQDKTQRRNEARETFFSTFGKGHKNP